MTLRQLGETTYNLDFEGSPQRFLFISDVHFDSVKCDRQLLTKHLDEALATNAGVFIFGDWFDLMQGMYDPRRSYSGLRPEYKSITYLDDVVNDSVSFLKKYKDIMLFFGRGNHETNIEKRLSTSPLDRLVQGLGAGIAGSYAGWIRMRSDDDYHTMVHFHHGYGGAAPRSKGVLNVDLDQKEFSDADIIVSGHTHQKWHVPISRERISVKMHLYVDTCHHLKLGSYKKLERFAGWEVEKGFSQPRLGGWWLELNKRRIRGGGIDKRVLDVTVVEAT
jgi:UDP-2,3-diacylglucosamine pyrophosphatase LpxH